MYIETCEPTYINILRLKNLNDPVSKKRQFSDSPYRFDRRFPKHWVKVRMTLTRFTFYHYRKGKNKCKELGDGGIQCTQLGVLGVKCYIFNIPYLLINRLFIFNDFVF